MPTAGAGAGRARCAKRSWPGANRAAIDLYQHLGFRLACTYHYRALPA